MWLLCRGCICAHEHITEVTWRWQVTGGHVMSREMSHVMSHEIPQPTQHLGKLLYFKEPSLCFIFKISKTGSCYADQVGFEH